MATIEFINKKEGVKHTYSHMKRTIDYIKRPDKAPVECITGINCDSENAFYDFVLTKEIFRKTDTARLFVHFTQNFSPKDKLTAKTAHEIGLKLAKKIPEGFQILMATHVDKAHLHNHFVINTVNAETGKVWQQSSKELEELKAYSDQLCREYGLNVIRHKKEKHKNRGQYRAEKRGQSWKYELFLAVKSTLKYSTSKEEFIKNMNVLGYSVKWEDSRKYITFTTPNGRPCRNNKLFPPENFTKEAMEKRFSLNRQFAERKENYENKRQLEEKQNLLIEAIKKLSYSLPSENAKQYPLTYLEGQALKEKFKEKEKGEGLDWER